jgi:DNA-binding MarR family transcriptional regulator
LPDGEKRLKEMLATLREVDETLSERLTPNERQTLFRLLGKLGHAKVKRAAAA